MNIQTQVELSKHRLLPFQGDIHHRREDAERRMDSSKPALTR